jgi:hypothetical protein
MAKLRQYGSVWRVTAPKEEPVDFLTEQSAREYMAPPKPEPEPPPPPPPPKPETATAKPKRATRSRSKKKE